MFKQLLLKFLQRSNSASNESDDNQPEMSFLDHLEELRWHILKIVAGLLIATIACAFFVDFIIQKILLGPLIAVGLKAQVLTPYGIVMLYFQAVLICGLIISMPNTLYWLWKFVSPGLMPKERRYVSGIVGFTSFCFFSGVAFGYFILLPAALDFFAHFGTENITLNVAIDRYVSFVLALILGAGLVFELPMISYFLSKMGILTPAFMRHYRRHAYVVILLISAIVTPTPDIVTQLLLAAPMFVLYEVSIFISKIVLRKKERASKEENTIGREEHHDSDQT